MRILTRYVLKEMIPPTFLGLGFYTFILLMRQLFDLAEMIIKRSLPFTVVLKLLGLALPHIVVLTIPMALLFGILIAVGRLSSDSEVIAMRAVGISTTKIYRPVFYFSFALFLVNLFVMNVIVPAGNAASVDLRSRIFASTIEKEIKPRVFYDEYENRVIYINDIDKTGTWRGVFVSDTTDPDRQQIIVAQSGKLSYLQAANQMWLNLQDAQTHVFSARRSDRYDVNSNASQRFLLPDKFSQPATRSSRSVREMDLAQLLEELPRARERDPMDHRMVLVEIHKKFSIPFACLAFGIVALPLGITNRRGGKSSGFSLSIGLILVYYLLLSNGEDMARNGKVPPAIAMWVPNLVILAFGIYLLSRANADASVRQGGGWFARLKHRISLWRIEKEKAEVGGESSNGSVLARLDIPFPNTLDRYVLREFLKTLALILLSAASLYVIVDYTSISGEIAENRIPLNVVASYYRYFLLQVVDQTLPVSVLVGTLVTFALFSKNNEVTAMKAHGISLYRIALPVLAMAAVVSVISYFLLDFVLPYSNERANKLKNQIKGKETRQSFSANQRQWVFGKGKYLFNFLSFDKDTNTLSQVQVFEFDPVNFRLTRRVWAQEAHFDGNGWVFSNGWIRSFGPQGSSYSPIYTPIRLHYPERPNYFAFEAKVPNQMTFAELSRYIRDLRHSGYESDELMVQLYQKTSWPFISLVMAAIALPFSFKMGKKGTFYGVGIALLLAFVYWMFFGIFTKFGEVGNLPAILSAWSANILFIIAAVYLFLRVET